MSAELGAGPGGRGFAGPRRGRARSFVQKALVFGATSADALRRCRFRQVWHGASVPLLPLFPPDGRIMTFIVALKKLRMAVTVKGSVASRLYTTTSFSSLIRDRKCRADARSSNRPHVLSHLLQISKSVLALLFVERTVVTRSSGLTARVRVCVSKASCMATDVSDFSTAH